MQRLSLYVITEGRNGASIALLERLGFRLVGFHTQHTLFKGEYCDEVRFERSG